MAAPSPAKMSPIPTAAEQPFIARIQKEIPQRYATLADATKAGYFQYLAEDKTGAISWVSAKSDARERGADPAATLATSMTMG